MQTWLVTRETSSRGPAGSCCGCKLVHQVTMWLTARCHLRLLECCPELCWCNVYFLLDSPGLEEFHQEFLHDGVGFGARFEEAEGEDTVISIHVNNHSFPMGSVSSTPTAAAGPKKRLSMCELSVCLVLQISTEFGVGIFEMVQSWVGECLQFIATTFLVLLLLNSICGFLTSFQVFRKENEKLLDWNCLLGPPTPGRQRVLALLLLLFWLSFKNL